MSRAESGRREGLVAYVSGSAFRLSVGLRVVREKLPDDMIPYGLSRRTIAARRTAKCGALCRA